MDVLVCNSYQFSMTKWNEIWSPSPLPQKWILVCCYSGYSVVYLDNIQQEIWRTKYDIKIIIIWPDLHISIMNAASYSVLHGHARLPHTTFTGVYRILAPPTVIRDFSSSMCVPLWPLATGEYLWYINIDLIMRRLQFVYLPTPAFAISYNQLYNIISHRTLLSVRILSICLIFEN